MFKFLNKFFKKDKKISKNNLENNLENKLENKNSNVVPFKKIGKECSLSKSQRWLNIESAPKDKHLLLAIDSYDCSWIYESGIFSNSESNNNHFNWKAIHVDNDLFLQMPYTHWFIPTYKNLNWMSINFAPKDKVVILGSRKNNTNEMDFCVGWWFKDINDWVTSSCTPINRKFNYFAIPKNLNLLTLNDLDGSLGEKYDN